jgi:raffinose/stachyose/melibiose transport system permease protein
LYNEIIVGAGAYFLQVVRCRLQLGMDKPSLFQNLDMRSYCRGWKLERCSQFVVFALPFGIFFMRAFFLRLPQELAEAAKIDGASEFGVFWRVMLPLATPGISTLAVFQFLGAWNAFLIPLLYIQQEELRPLALGLMFFRGRYTQNIPLIMAGAMIMIIPIIVVYIFLQRKFIEGMTAGALKG